MKRGKFIVIYGPNNIGKTTQVELLAKRIQKEGKRVVSYKYPVYDLEPTGPKLFKLLRSRHGLTEYEMQKIFTLNRIDFEPTIKTHLEKGDWIVAEDYKWTGVIWGTVNGVNYQKMISLNKGLLDEDVCILMDGERFLDAKEEGHRNEDSNNDKWERSRKLHLKVAKDNNWPIVNANQNIHDVTEDIWQKVIGDSH